MDGLFAAPDFLQTVDGEVASTTLGIPPIPGLIAFGLDPSEDEPVMFLTIGTGLPLDEGEFVPLTLSLRLTEDGVRDILAKMNDILSTLNNDRLANVPAAFLQAFGD